MLRCNTQVGRIVGDYASMRKTATAPIASPAARSRLPPPDRDLRRSYSPSRSAPVSRRSDASRDHSPSRSAPVFVGATQVAIAAFPPRPRPPPPHRAIATCVAPTKTMPTPVARCRSVPAAAIFGRGPVRFGAGGADRRPWRQNWLKLDPGQPLSIFTLRLRNKHLDWKRTVREISHGFPTLPRRDRDIGRRPSCVHSTPRSPVAKP